MSIAVRLAQKAAGRSGAFNVAQGVTAMAALRGGQAPSAAASAPRNDTRKFEPYMR